MKCLKKVILSADVYAICLQHALTTEKEEVMGLLIGEVNEELAISHVISCVILHRSDKQPDRVEISPEQLCKATTIADQLSNKLDKTVRVLGWYHSHPHITVWPSHVDVRTQNMYQHMDPMFIGLIFSVYQNDKNSITNTVQMTCFQAIETSSLERMEVEVVIENSPLRDFNLQAIMKLPGILLQEEVDGNQKEENNIDDYLVKIHNEAYKTISLVHLIVKVTKPMYEDLENKLKATHLKIRALEKRRRQYENDNFIDLAPFY